MGAPRLRPTSTRNYGKGGTTYSGAPDMGVRGAGIGYGGGFSGLGGIKICGTQTLQERPHSDRPSAAAVNTFTGKGASEQRTLPGGGKP